MVEKTDYTKVPDVRVILGDRFAERRGSAEADRHSDAKDYMKHGFGLLYRCAYQRRNPNPSVDMNSSTQDVVDFLSVPNSNFVPDAYNQKDFGKNLLHVMCEHLMDDLVPHALSIGVPYDDKSTEGHHHIPLWYAISNAVPETADKAVNIMRHMKAHAGDRPIWGEHELNMLLSATTGPVVQELIDQGANPYHTYQLERFDTRNKRQRFKAAAAEEGGTLLHRALYCCDQPGVESLIITLLDAGVNLETKTEKSGGPPQLLISGLERLLSDVQKQNKSRGVKEPLQSQFQKLKRCSTLFENRRQAALKLTNAFQQHHDITQLPDDALVYFSNIGKEGLLFTPEVWQQHPQKMLAMLEKMPPAFVTHQGVEREVTAMRAMLANELPDTCVAAGWSACEDVVQNTIQQRHG